jgi:DNA (cytosine-5)-methyltransferase 1
MRFGSVCSGIEAASVAWHPLGWKAAWLSEIEAFPSAVLNHHYPDVPNLGDMTLLPERILSGEVEAPDVFCGGTPCQAFSVAGLRKSLDDARGNLSLTFVGIANAIDHVRSVRSDSPAIVFWENVPGVLNTKDNAFGCFLAALAGEDDALVPSGQKWTNAGCVFGPQRAVAWRVLDAQYFGVAQRRRRVFVVASARTDFDPTKVLFEFQGVRRDTAPSREKREVAPTIPARSLGGGGLGTDFDCDGGVIQHKQWPAEVSSTLDTTFGTKQGLEDQHVNAGCPLFVPAISPCLETQAGSLRQPCTQAYVVTPPLTASLSTPLGNGGKDAFITAVQPIAFSGQMSNPHTDVDIMQTLQAKNPMAVATAMQVRRLTPVECERLQGFPDNYTDIKLKGKPTPDGPRYKALGNSWAVPVVRWIGSRIVQEVQRLESISPKENP